MAYAASFFSTAYAIRERRKERTAYNIYTIAWIGDASG
jgi:hypothetical protein